jgi:UDP-N-acetylmuramoyl-tripeptide--D-alanyl-D-alanine ligase
MRSSIAVAHELAVREGRRLVLVLGEMRELGALSASEHASLGRFAGAREAAHVFGVGGDARRLVEAALSSGQDATFAEDADRALPEVLRCVLPRDVVLVKGSRGVATEKIVRGLVEERGRPA